MNKDPQSTLDYALDWGPWLAPVQDTIADVSWSVPSGITEVKREASTTRAIIWLSGGTVGRTYELVCTITTAAGRTDERVLTIRVANR